MAKFVFTENFDWRPYGTRKVVVAYERGQKVTLPRAASQAALAAGKGYFQPKFINPGDEDYGDRS